ncbi:MAG: hypothetical protein H7Y42_19880 [Chitinophagaceae bacterium]|nr:hypothetical protein [Chitinophagaceae bacterium]
MVIRKSETFPQVGVRWFVFVQLDQESGTGIGNRESGIRNWESGIGYA